MLNVTPISAFETNYFWVIKERHGVTVVDPGDAEPVLEYLKQNGLALSAILITHRHGDHIGGVSKLLQKFPVKVYGPGSISVVNTPVGDGDLISCVDFEESSEMRRARNRAAQCTDAYLSSEVSAQQNISLKGKGYKVMTIPGHTLDHVGYYREGCFFCGDTLFGGGCGRINDSTAETLQKSILKIADLPLDTLLYYAHEYTIHNLKFAQILEPNNEQIKIRLAAVEKLQAEGKPSVPSTLREELQTNPFLRCTNSEIVKRAADYLGRLPESDKETFKAIRSLKDRF